MHAKSQRIRLVFMIGELGLGGSEHQLFLLLTQLDPALFETHIIVFNPSNYFMFNAELEQLGIKVWPIPPEVRNIPQRIRFLYGLLRRLSPHIVHSWTVHDNPYAGIVGLLAGVPVRYGSLRNSLELAGTKNLNPVFKFLSLYSTSKLFVNADSIARELRERHFPAQRIVVLPNCVNIALFENQSAPSSLLADLKIKPQAKLVGIIANLRSVKNHELFIRGMAQVIGNRDDVYGLMIGQPVPQEPHLPHHLDSLIKQLGLTGRIIQLGFRRDVPELMQLLDVICLTSHTEGMPNAVLEAMAVGKPVVATRVGGVPQLIQHGTSGLVIEPNNPAEFADAVCTLLSDEALARQIASNGYQHVREKYNCAQIAQQITNVYQEALRT